MVHNTSPQFFLCIELGTYLRVSTILWDILDGTENVEITAMYWIIYLFHFHAGETAGKS